jgi:hypothetical protein
MIFECCRRSKGNRLSLSPSPSLACPPLSLSLSHCHTHPRVRAHTHLGIGGIWNTYRSWKQQGRICFDVIPSFIGYPLGIGIMIWCLRLSRRKHIVMLLTSLVANNMYCNYASPLHDIFQCETKAIDLTALRKLNEDKYFMSFPYLVHLK